VAAALGEHRPDVRVIGVQAEGAATVPESLQKGAAHSIDAPRTVADGIATGGISRLTYAHIERYVDDVVTVSDEEIATAVMYLLERTKQMVEGAGAVTVAALESDAVDIDGERVMAVLSGGNLSITTLQQLLTHALTNRRQLVQLRVRIRDEPGEMHVISGLIADFDANIRSVDHRRSIGDLTVGEAFLDFEVETSGESATDRLVESLECDGYEVSRLS
jgi:threonine dehydratase